MKTFNNGDGIKNPIGVREIGPAPVKEAIEESPSTLETFAARVSYDNQIVNTAWKFANELMTFNELIVKDDEPFNPLEKQYVDLADPEDLPSLMDSRTKEEFFRRVGNNAQKRYARQTADEGSIGGNLLGGVFNSIISFTDWVPVAAALSKPKIFNNILTGAAAGMTGFAVAQTAEEFILQNTQEVRSTEESIKNVLYSSALGGLFGGSAGFVKSGRLEATKRMVQEAVDGNDVKFRLNGKNEVDGINVYDGGGSVGAAATKTFDLAGESLVGWGRNGELQVAKPFIWMAGKFARNPVVMGLTSKSKSVAKFTNDMYEHNMDVIKSTIRGEYKQQSLQSRLGKYDVISAKADLDIANSYFEYLGLPADTPWANIPKSLLIKKEGALPFNDYVREFSMALSRGGVSDIPQVSKAAKKLYEDVYEPLYKELVELGQLAPNIKPYGAVQYLNRIYDKDYIVANKLKVSDFLYKQFGRTNDRVISAQSNLNQMKASLAELKASNLIDEASQTEVKALERGIKKEQKKIERKMRKGAYSPDMLVGEAGMSHENLKQLKGLRKNINKHKTELRHAEEELKVHKRSINPERKPGQKNVEADAKQKKLESEIESHKEKLKQERLKIDQEVKAGNIPKEIVFKGKNDTHYLKKQNKGTLKFRPILDDDLLNTSVSNTIDNILNITEEDMGNQIMGLLRGGSSGNNFLMPRVLMIDDEALYASRMLVGDPRLNIKAYTKRAGRLVEMEKYLKGRGWDGKSAKLGFLTDGIKKDYQHLEEAQLRRFEKRREKATTKAQQDKVDIKEQKANIRLQKDLERDLALCTDTYRRITGGYQMEPGLMKGAIKASRFFSNWAYGTQLGSLLLLSLQDAVAGIFRHGPVNLIQGGVAPFIKNIVKLKNIDNVRLKQQASDLCLGNDTLRTFMDARFYTGKDYELPMGTLERVAEGSASAMGIANFTTMWSDMCNAISATASTSRILRDLQSYVDGTLSKNYEAQLGILGLNDKGLAERILAQYKQYGEELSGGYLANFQAWGTKAVDEASTKEALAMKDIMQNAIRQEVRSTIFQGKNIASYPSGLNPGGISQSFLMYMGWMFTATMNYSIPMFQRLDPNKIMGAAAMMSVGMLVNPLRQISRGEEPETDPAKLIWGGILNSGVGGIPVDLFNKANAIGGIFPDIVVDRYKGKGLELLAGMPGTMIDTTLNLAGQAKNNEWNKADLKKVKRIIPLVEALWIKKFTNDYIDTLDLPETRSQARKGND